jgi:hypothetical protein
MTSGVNQFQPEPSFMTLPSNGITPDVIREVMPPYHLSQDLLEGTFAALPPPPSDATPAWREARATRLIAEIATLMPATAGQARMAAQILVLREAADTLASQVYAPGATMEQMCRAGRGAAEVARSATALGRELARCQQKPAPFFGNVVAEGVDVAAVAAGWGSRAVHGEAAADVGPVPAGMAGSSPAMTERENGDNDAMQQPAAGPRPGGEAAADAGPVPAGMAELIPGSNPGTAMTMGESSDSPAATDGPVPGGMAGLIPGSSPGTAMTMGESGDGPAGTEGDGGHSPAMIAGGRAPTRRGQDAGATPEWVVTPLDQGPGWTREVVRRRTSGEAGIGAAPGAAV